MVGPGVGLYRIPAQKQDLSMQLRQVQKLDMGLGFIDDIVIDFLFRQRRTVELIFGLIKEDSYSPFSLREQEMIQLAFSLSLKQHDGQQRDSGVPYVSHEYHAAYIMTLLGYGPIEIITASLHDTLEDANGKTPGSVRRTRYDLMNKVHAGFNGYGPRVLAGMMALSKKPVETFKGDTDKVDAELYLRIRRALEFLPYLDAIKVADAISSLHDVQHMKPKNGMTARERQQRYLMTVEAKTLPLARDLDASGTLPMEIAPYMEDKIAECRAALG